MAVLGRFGRQVVWPVVVVTATLGLGIVLGQALTSPSQETVTSLVIMLVFFVLLVAKPKISFLTWLVLYPFLGNSIQLELGAGLPDLSLTRFCVVFLTVMLLAQVAVHRRSMFKTTKTDMAAVAFVLALSAASLATGNVVWAFQRMLDLYLVPVLLYCVARNLTNSRQDVEQLVNALLFLGFYSAVYLIYERETGNILFSDVKTVTTYGYGVAVVRGLLGGPHIFGWRSSLKM